MVQIYLINFMTCSAPTAVQPTDSHRMLINVTLVTFYVLYATPGAAAASAPTTADHKRCVHACTHA